MDRLSDSTCSFPIERVPRFQSVTSRPDGTVSLDDLDQLHSELEKLFGAASLHLNVIEQYLNDDEQKKKPSESTANAKRKSKSTDSGKKAKQKNVNSKVDSGPRSTDCGIEFIKLRKLDEKVMRGGTYFSFETLRDMPPNGQLRRDASVSGDLCSVTNGPTVPTLQVKNVAAPKAGGGHTHSVASGEEPIPPRVLRRTAQSRGNSASTPPVSSPPSLVGDTHTTTRRRETRFSSPSPPSSPTSTSKRCPSSVSRRNGEWHALGGLLTPSLFGSASRLVGGRLLRRRPPGSANSRSLNSTPQRSLLSPQSRTNSVAAAPPSPAKVARPSSSRPKAKRTSVSAGAVAAGAHSRHLVALPPGFTYRHDVPKAFWRRFDEIFMREFREEDLAFVNALRACVTLSETELARLTAPIRPQSLASRASPRPNATDKRRLEPITIDDDSPISKRLRMRCASGSQIATSNGQPHDATQRIGHQLPVPNGLGDPLSICARLSPAAGRLASPNANGKQRESVLLENNAIETRPSATAPRLAPTITVRNYNTTKRNGCGSLNSNCTRNVTSQSQLEAMLRGSRELNGLVSPRSRALGSGGRNVANAKVKCETAVNGCVKGDAYPTVKREHETAEDSPSSSSPSVCASLTPSRAELSALAKLVDAEKQAAFAHVRREIALLSPSAPKCHNQTEGTFKVPVRLEPLTNVLTDNPNPTSPGKKQQAKAGANTSAQAQRRPSLITDYFGRSNSSTNTTKRQRIAGSESIANLLFCYSSDCETQLAELLVSAADCTNGARSKATVPGCKVRALRTLVAYEDEPVRDETSSNQSGGSKSGDARKRKRTAADETSVSDFTKPLSVRTPAKITDSLFSSPSNAESRLLLPTASANRKQPDTENIELQRLIVELRCTTEWSKHVCDGLVATITRRIDCQPMLARLREIERTVSEMNAKMNDPQPHRCAALSDEEMKLARRVINEREQLFHKLGIYDDR